MDGQRRRPAATAGTSIYKLARVSRTRRGGEATRHWRFCEGRAGGGTLSLMVGRRKGEGRARTASMSRFYQLHSTE